VRAAVAWLAKYADPNAMRRYGEQARIEYFNGRMLQCVGTVEFLKSYLRWL